MTIQNMGTMEIGECLEMAKWALRERLGTSLAVYWIDKATKALEPDDNLHSDPYPDAQDSLQDAGDA